MEKAGNGTMASPPLVSPPPLHLIFSSVFIIIKRNLPFQERKNQKKVRKSGMIKYIHCGHFISDGEWIHPTRRIDNYEIIFVLKGNVYLSEENTSYSANAGDVLLLSPGCLHGGTQKSSNTEFYWVHFSSDIRPAFCFFAPANGYEIISQIRRLLHIANMPGYPPAALDAAIVMLISELTFQFPEAVAKRKIIYP